MRLIDADALIKYFKENSNGDYTEWFLENIEDAIKDAPTVQREGWVSLTDMQITNIGMQHQSLHQVAKAIDNELRAINNV
jgi:hypothetical protein